MRPYEWAAAAVAGLGVLGLGLSAEPDHLDHPTAPAAHIVLAFLGLVALLGENVEGGSVRVGFGACVHAAFLGLVVLLDAGIAGCGHRWGRGSMGEAFVVRLCPSATWQ